VSRFPLKLIMVLEQDEQLGTRIVQLIHQETPYQALLATSPFQARRMLHQLSGDFCLLADDSFPQEDLEHLAFSSRETRPNASFSLTFPPSTGCSRAETDVKSIVKAVKLLLSAYDS
jgi:hypothetical protein